MSRSVSNRRKLASADERLHLIRLVHVAYRELQLDKDTYRAALVTATGKDSCSRMSAAELQRALDHFKRVGFKVRAKARPSRPLDQRPESQKIRALWLLLHQLGAVKNSSEEALAAYVKRIAHVEALQWIDGHQAERLIETMKKWAMRFLPDAVQQLADGVDFDTLDDESRARLRLALGRAWGRMTFDPMLVAWESLQTIAAGGRLG